MRVVALAALAALAACAPQPTIVYSPEELAAFEREWNDPAAVARRAAAREQAARERAAANETATQPPAVAARQEAAARDRRAATICEGRANMAAAQPVFGGFGLTGVMMGVAQQEQARVEVFRACMSVYQQTGVMPSF